MVAAAAPAPRDNPVPRQLSEAPPLETHARATHAAVSGAQPPLQQNSLHVKVEKEAFAAPTPTALSLHQMAGAAAPKPEAQQTQGPAPAVFPPHLHPQHAAALQQQQLSAGDAASSWGRSTPPLAQQQHALAQQRHQNAHAAAAAAAAMAATATAAAAAAVLARAQQLQAGPNAQQAPHHLPPSARAALLAGASGRFSPGILPPVSPYGAQPQYQKIGRAHV